MSIATDSIATLKSWLDGPLPAAPAEPDVRSCPRCAGRMLAFDGGWGCERCPAWISAPRMEHTVELSPATRIDLTEAIAALRASLADQPEPPETVAVPLLPAQTQLAGMTGPVPLNEPDDRQLAIVAELLPVVREGISLSTLLVVAARIEALR